MITRCIVRLQAASVLMRGVVVSGSFSGSRAALRRAAPLPSAVTATLRGLATAVTPLMTAEGALSPPGSLGCVVGCEEEEDDETVLIDTMFERKTDK